MDKDIIVTCPYNKAHRIRKYKLMTHLVKCKKQHNTANKVSCPLNGSHIMNQSDLRDHLQYCPNLSSLIHDNVEEKTDTIPIMNSDSHVSKENWDEAPEVPTYDAVKNSASRKVIRCVSGLTKSERVKYKLSERERMANLNGASAVERKPCLLKEEIIEERPLRPLRGIAQALLNDEEPTISQETRDMRAQKEDFATQAKSATANDSCNTVQKTYDTLPSNNESDDNCKDSTFFADESLYVTFEDQKDTKIDSSLTHKPLELSTTSTDYDTSINHPGPSTRNQYLSGRGRGKSSSSTAQSQEIRGKKKQKDDVIEVDAPCNVFGTANNSMAKTMSTENICDASTSEEQVTDKLLDLLRDSTKKINLSDETKESDKNKDLTSKKLKDILCEFSDRLNHLANVQNVTVECSARLAEEVNNLKLKSCCNTQSSILNNPRCAANFTEMLSSTYTKDHNVSQEANFMRGTSSSFNSSRDDTFNLRDNSELHKLKTPKDFGHN